MSIKPVQSVSKCAHLRNFINYLGHFLAIVNKLYLIKPMSRLTVTKLYTIVQSRYIVTIFVSLGIE